MRSSRISLPNLSQIEDCLARDNSTFPRCSALLGQEHKRSILQVLAWNPREAPVPVSYGKKKSYSLMRAVSIIPMPMSWSALRAGEAAAEASLSPASISPPRPLDASEVPAVIRHSDAAVADRVLSGSERAAEAEERPRASVSSSRSSSSRESVRPSPNAVVQSPSGWAGFRQVPVVSDRVVKVQARTLELEMEVAAMAERLRMARGLLA